MEIRFFVVLLLVSATGVVSGDRFSEAVGAATADRSAAAAGVFAAEDLVCDADEDCAPGQQVGSIPGGATEETCKEVGGDQVPFVIVQLLLGGEGGPKSTFSRQNCATRVQSSYFLLNTIWTRFYGMLGQWQKYHKIGFLA